MHIPEQVKKMLSCEHKVENVLADYEQTFYDITRGTFFKTMTMLMVCTKCNELIRTEYVIDSGNTKKPKHLLVKETWHFVGIDNYVDINSVDAHDSVSSV